MIHIDPASLAALTPAKAKAAALEAFTSAAADPAFSDWRALSELLAASLQAKPRRKDSDDATPVWWADYELPRRGPYLRHVLAVTFACGRVVRCNVHEVPGKPMRVAKACRVAVSFYRGGSGRGEVPAMVQVENVSTGELYDAGVCSALTAALRVDPGPVVYARPPVTVEAVERMAAEVQRRRDARARVAALREAGEGSGLAPDRDFMAAIVAGEEELARMRAALYGPDAGEDTDEALDVIEAGEAVLCAEACAEAEPDPEGAPAPVAATYDPQHVRQDADGAWLATLDGKAVPMAERYPEHVVLIATSHNAYTRLPEGPAVLGLRYPQMGRVVALASLVGGVPRGCRVSGPRHLTKRLRAETVRFAACVTEANRLITFGPSDPYLDHYGHGRAEPAPATWVRRQWLQDALFAFGFEPLPSPSEVEGPVAEPEPAPAVPEPAPVPVVTPRPRLALRLAAGLLATSAVSSFVPRMPAPYARVAA